MLGHLGAEVLKCSIEVGHARYKKNAEDAHDRLGRRLTLVPCLRREAKWQVQNEEQKDDRVELVPVAG